MKKFISGVIVGALLFSGASAFANSVGLIGKKVTGVFIVEKDGKKIADAAIIDGTAYAPVRAVSQASGATLAVEGKKIIMGGTNVTNSELSADEISIKVTALNLKRDSIAKKIESTEGGIKMYETVYIPNAESNFTGADDELSRNASEKALSSRKAELEQRKAELADLQKQLSEIDAQISELEK